ncbi:MAG TPA: hypothetical protein VGI47_02630 [Candidatus Binataceae bacterium]
MLEYKVSAVVDLYEPKLAERRHFVKLFLESLIHVSRDLWRPTLVILDEAHIYCPERGSRDQFRGCETGQRVGPLSRTVDDNRIGRQLSHFSFNRLEIIPIPRAAD